MTKTHEIKLNEKFVDAVLSGEKCFEIRKNDRGYQKGDIVKFIPIDDRGLYPYTLASSMIKDIEYEITYVLNGWGLQDGYVVFGIKERTK